MLDACSAELGNTLLRLHPVQMERKMIGNRLLVHPKACSTLIIHQVHVFGTSNCRFTEDASRGLCILTRAFVLSLPGKRLHLKAILRRRVTSDTSRGFGIVWSPGAQRDYYYRYRYVPTLRRVGPITIGVQGQGSLCNHPGRVQVRACADPTRKAHLFEGCSSRTKELASSFSVTCT